MNTSADTNRDQDTSGSRLDARPDARPDAHPTPPPLPVETRPDAHAVGMVVFLISEVAFFSTLLVAYLVYLGHSLTGPTPREALSLPLVIGTTICLLSSSITIHLAEKAVHAGNLAAFKGWWTLTIVLGAAFLLGTAYEWYELIVHHHLTISRNLFGTTFFTLVGFHALHVTVGLLLLILILSLAWRGLLAAKHSRGIKFVAWYWHFVDVVWIVVFLTVYVFGR